MLDYEKHYLIFGMRKPQKNPNFYVNLIHKGNNLQIFKEQIHNIKILCLLKLLFQKNIILYLILIELY